jgi:hypothetical protein
VHDKDRAEGHAKRGMMIYPFMSIEIQSDEHTKVLCSVHKLPWILFLKVMQFVCCTRIIVSRKRCQYIDIGDCLVLAKGRIAARMHMDEEHSAVGHVYKDNGPLAQMSVRILRESGAHWARSTSLVHKDTDSCAYIESAMVHMPRISCGHRVFGKIALLRYAMSS